MKTRTTTIAIGGALGFLLWGLPGGAILAAWWNGEAPGFASAAIAAFACLGWGCTAVNLATERYRAARQIKI